MQKKIVGFFIVVVFSMTLIMIPQADADEWDGKRKRRSSERAGRTVQMDTISGSIMEILQSRDNVFLRVGSSESSQWVALMKPSDGGSLPQLQVGDSVSLQPGVVMNNYHIKGLKRDFDQVVFSPGIDQHSTSPSEPTYRDRYDRDSYDRDSYDRDSYDRERYNRD